MKYLKILALTGLISIFLSACGTDTEPEEKQAAVTEIPADLLLLNGYIYTVDAQRSAGKKCGFRRLQHDAAFRAVSELQNA